MFSGYNERAQGDRNDETNKTERLCFNKWIAPLLGNMPMKDISQDLLETLKKNVRDAGRSARTITYPIHCKAGV
ncbi:MAG: hypothetical protein LBR78_02875 [Holosporales bacterium]|nr:hypothetical protein [Holosporales bacterium]